MIDDATRSRVHELHEKKKSLREIAAELGISKSAVSTTIKKMVATPKIIISEIKPVDMDARKADEFMNSLTGNDTKASKPAKNMDDIPDSFLAAIMAGPPKKGRGRPPKTQNKEESFFAAIMADPPAEKRQVRQAQPAQQIQQIQQTQQTQQPNKGELIGKITLNVQTFPDMLADIIKPSRDEFIDNLGSKSQSDLASLLSLIEYKRSVANTAAVMKTLTLTGASLLEMGTKRFLKMRTDGFADMLRNEPSIDGILKEIAMENANGIISKYQSPTARLTLLVVTSLMSVDARNRQRSATAPIAESVEKQYGDL